MPTKFQLCTKITFNSLFSSGKSLLTWATFPLHLLDLDSFLENKYCDAETIIKTLLESNNCRVYYTSIKGESPIHAVKKPEENEKTSKSPKYFPVCQKKIWKKHKVLNLLS